MSRSVVSVLDLREVFADSSFYGSDVEVTGSGVDDSKLSIVAENAGPSKITFVEPTILSFSTFSVSKHTIEIVGLQIKGHVECEYGLVTFRSCTFRPFPDQEAVITATECIMTLIDCEINGSGNVFAMKCNRSRITLSGSKIANAGEILVGGTSSELHCMNCAMSNRGGFAVAIGNGIESTFKECIFTESGKSGIVASEATISISDCDFSGCMETAIDLRNCRTACVERATIHDSKGSAIGIIESNVRISECKVFRCDDNGMFCLDSNVVVNNCSFDGMKCPVFFIVKGKTVVTSCKFEKCDGNGINCSEAYIQMMDCEFANLKCPAVVLSDESSAVMTSCRILNVDDMGMCCESSKMKMNNCDFEDIQCSALTFSGGSEGEVAHSRIKRAQMGGISIQGSVVKVSYCEFDYIKNCAIFMEKRSFSEINGCGMRDGGGRGVVCSQSVCIMKGCVIENMGSAIELTKKSVGDCVLCKLSECNGHGVSCTKSMVRLAECEISKVNGSAIVALDNAYIDMKSSRVVDVTGSCLYCDAAYANIHECIFDYAKSPALFIVDNGACDVLKTHIRNVAAEGLICKRSNVRLRSCSFGKVQNDGVRVTDGVLTVLESVFDDVIGNAVVGDRSLVMVSNTTSKCVPIELRRCVGDIMRCDIISSKSDGIRVMERSRVRLNFVSIINAVSFGIFSTTRSEVYVNHCLVVGNGLGGFMCGEFSKLDITNTFISGSMSHGICVITGSRAMVNTTRIAGCTECAVVVKPGSGGSFAVAVSEDVISAPDVPTSKLFPEFEKLSASVTWITEMNSKVMCNDSQRRVSLSMGGEMYDSNANTECLTTLPLAPATCVNCGNDVGAFIYRECGHAACCKTCWHQKGVSKGVCELCMRKDVTPVQVKCRKNNMCQLCCKRQSTVVHFPCLHGSCLSCAVDVGISKCPVCRRSARSFIQRSYV